MIAMKVLIAIHLGGKVIYIIKSSTKMIFFCETFLYVLVANT